MNVLSKQGQTIKSHSHTINHGHTASAGKPSIFIYDDYGSGMSGAYVVDRGSWQSKGKWLTTYTSAPSVTVNSHSGNSGDTGDTETRPDNFTYRIWKRTN